MGGDTIIAYSNIEKIEITRKLLPEKEVVKLALIKGLESHNLAIHLVCPVVVVKAFGIKRTARVLLLQIDQHTSFLTAVENSRSR
jgi:hypothetical protein